MKLITVAVIACSVLISGCVLNMTQSELRDKAFYASYKGFNNSKVIAPCVAGEWKKIASFLQEIQSRPTINGDSVWAEMNNGGVVFLVDIFDGQPVSTANLYIDPYLVKNRYADFSAWQTAILKCVGDVPIKTTATPEISKQAENNLTPTRMKELNMNCRDNSDCGYGFSCRTSSNKGGTECRADGFQQPSTEQAKAAEQNTQATPIPIAQPSGQSIQSNSPSDEYDEVKYTKRGGVYLIPVLINDVLQMKFVVDSGAADVNISPDVYFTLLKTGTIKKRDSLPGQHYRLADGSIVKSGRFIIRTLKIGNRVLKNVTCSISDSIDADMLLGQSALEQLGNFAFNHETGTVRFNK